MTPRQIKALEDSREAVENALRSRVYAGKYPPKFIGNPEKRENTILQMVNGSSITVVDTHEAKVTGVNACADY